jgi:hypothetical protein
MGRFFSLASHRRMAPHDIWHAPLLLVLLLLPLPLSWSPFWRFDDGYILAFASIFRPWQALLEPVVTKAFSWWNLTPGLPLLFHYALDLLGLRPERFYIAQLGILWLSGMTTYVLLRRWIPHGPALFGAALFLLGAPTLHIANELMCAHYLVGLLLVTLSMLCFALALEHGSGTIAAIGALCYLAAAACKEVYVPLPCALLLLPQDKLHRRALFALPYFFVAVLYAIWRYRVLGALIGGYSLPANAATLPQALGMAVTHAPLLLIGPSWAGLLVLGGLLMLAVGNGLPKMASVWRWTALTGLLLLPLVPLARTTGLDAPNRYFFLSGWALSIAGATLLAGANRLTKATRAAAACIIALGTMVSTQYERAVLGPSAMRSEALYRFAVEPATKRILLTQGGEDPFYWDWMLNGFIRAINRQQGVDLRSIPVAATGVDPGSLQRSGFSVWAYAAECSCVRRLPASPPKETSTSPRITPYVAAAPVPIIPFGIGGRLETVRRDGRRLLLRGWLDLPPGDSGWELFPVLTQAPLTAKLLPSTAVEADGVGAVGRGFTLEITFPPSRSSQRPRLLCLGERSTLTRLTLLKPAVGNGCVVLGPLAR